MTSPVPFVTERESSPDASEAATMGGTGTNGNGGMTFMLFALRPAAMASMQAQPRAVLMKKRRRGMAERRI